MKQKGKRTAKEKSHSLILASQSKRRIQIFKELGLNFKACPSHAIEIKDDGKHSARYLVEKNAVLKVKEAATRFPNDCILAADTLVSSAGRIFEKPKNTRQARSMFQSYAQNKTLVWTALSFYNPKNKEISMKIQRSSFKAHPYSKAAFQKLFPYLYQAECSGGFSIEGLGALVFDNIHGSFYNILGLPVHSLFSLLEENGYSFVSFLKK